MTETGHIAAVTFDVGGTLIEPWPSVGHIYAEVAATHGWKGLSPELLNARFTDAWHACADFDHTRAGWEEIVKRTFQGLIAPGRLEFFPALYERFADADAWRIFDDVRPALNDLAGRGIRLGVISNWDERLGVLLQRLGLHECFDALAVSCETGRPKPAPAIFERAAAALGLPPAKILHVGDSIEMDFRGATRAGFQAVHLRRGAGSSDEQSVRSLAELPALMGKRIRMR